MHTLDKNINGRRYIPFSLALLFSIDYQLKERLNYFNYSLLSFAFLCYKTAHFSCPVGEEKIVIESDVQHHTHKDLFHYFSSRDIRKSKMEFSGYLNVYSCCKKVQKIVVYKIWLIMLSYLVKLNPCSSFYITYRIHKTV